MMKKFFKLSSLLLMLVSFASATSYAQNSLSLKPIDLEPGTEEVLELMFNNEDTFYGFSAEVTLPKGLEFMKKDDGKADIYLNTERTAKGEYQLVTNIVNGNKVLMGAFSTSDPQQPIEGSEGALVYIKVKVADDYHQGSLNLNNIKFIKEDDTETKPESNSSLIGVLPTSIILSDRGLGMQVIDGEKEEKELTVTFIPEWTTNKTVTWTMSDSDVATVIPEGVNDEGDYVFNVTAEYKGTATITVTTPNGKTAACFVSVGIPVTSVDMEPKSKTIMDSETLAITATPLPEDADNREFVQWYSSDETVATVDEKGIVTAIKAGEVTITAQCGSASGTCELTVIPTPAEKVIVSPNPAELKVGDSVTLTAEVLPEATTDKTVTWSSSDESIATVDADGKVTALALGEVTVTATCGTVSGTCELTVIPTPAESVTVGPTSAEIRVGESVSLAAEVKPDDTTYKTVTWSSSDESIATVDADGVVTGKGVGEVLITATCGTASATCSVKVNPVLAESITLSTESVELRVGETETLIATILPENTTYKTVTWTSSDESIATVDADGIVTAVALGEVTVTATCDDVSAECQVTVVRTPVTGISLTNTELFIKVGRVTDLAAIVHPSDATDPSVTWSSDDESIVTVDQNGIVTGVSVGTATITVTSVSDPEVTATCFVTVEIELIVVTGIEISESSLELIIGDSYTLYATVTPYNATDPTVTWRSSDLSIATVSQTGEITTTGVGEAIIYASTSNGITAECALTVLPRIIEVTDVALSNYELLMTEGEVTELLALVYPADATDQSVTWSTSDESIVTVDQNGNVTAIKQGNATVTVTTANGKTAECAVTVMPLFIAVEGIALNKSELELTEGDTFQLIATITPEDATVKTVTWVSSNESIVTVAEDGTVTAVAEGTATVYASSSNGLTAECKVTVVAPVVPVISISLSNTELLMRKGHSTDLIAIVRPDNATDKRVTWSSTDESIATVDQNGIITAHEVGEVTIIVTSVYDPTVRAECKVTVEDEAVITAVEKIILSDYELTLKEGDNYTLIATVLPEDATDKSVTWKSSDRAIATVDENGKITAVAEGTAIIYASSSNGLTAECHVTVVPDEIPVLSISLSNTELLMRKGYSTDLIAIVRPDDAFDKRVTWSSTDESIATVDETGKVTAHEVGEVIIIVTSVYDPTVTAQCKVTVEDEAVIVAVEKLILSDYELEMEIEDVHTIVATILPEDATDKTVTWKSSNRAVATVDESGNVTAVAEGTAIIYASSSNGLTEECHVTVLPAPVEVESITLSNTELLMREGHTAELIAFVRPDNAADKTVTWSTTDAAIATVDNYGLVTAVKQGNAIISAKSANGCQADCYVTVIPVVIAVEEIEVTPPTLKMIEGDEATLTATIKPADATDRTITWVSSDPAVATVSDNGEVTAVSAGAVSIYVSSSNGLTAECKVTVSQKIIDVTSITIDATDLVLYEAETAVLTATVLPANATDQAVIWSSDDPTIARVVNGIVTAVYPGETTLKAESANGVSATCKVTVKARPQTPVQLLRKGDGTTSTFVIMMGIPDAQLVAEGYGFVVGYTDSEGASEIIAETPLRYCHTTPEIFNNATYDFWAFAFIENENGEVVTSHLRHLDGSIEVCLDPSKYGFSFSGKGQLPGGEGWITLTPNAIHIAASSTDEMQIAVYTPSGVRLYSKSYKGEVSVHDVIELDRFTAGTYVVAVNCDGKKEAKKIVVR